MGTTTLAKTRTSPAPAVSLLDEGPPAPRHRPIHLEPYAWLALVVVGLGVCWTQQTWQTTLIAACFALGGFVAAIIALRGEARCRRDWADAEVARSDSHFDVLREWVTAVVRTESKSAAERTQLELLRRRMKNLRGREAKRDAAERATEDVAA